MRALDNDQLEKQKAMLRDARKIAWEGKNQPLYVAVSLLSNVLEFILNQMAGK